MNARFDTRAMRAIVAVVAIVLVVGACGSPGQDRDDAATLEVACYPAADIWIDGTWKGSTPVSISVTPGSHEVILKQVGFEEHAEKFEVTAGTHHNLDAVLIAQDLDDETVLASLARPFELTLEPFEAPEVHRGGRRSPMAVLLWPQGDVRESSLSSFGIEVGEGYDGDGFLFFRKGRKVLYKEPYDPETMTTVASIPLEVLEQIATNDKVTWGISFESRRKRAIQATFRAVDHRKADRRIEKMRVDQHLQRQPLLARQLLVAKTLENYRLYTEALVLNLEILQENPDSMQPYQGIVTTLRRLDAKDSRLWSIASQFVSGSGRGRTAQNGIAAFNPVAPRTVPVPTGIPGVATGPTRPNTLGPGDSIQPGPQSGVTPPTAGPDGTPQGATAAGLLAQATDLAREAEQAGQVAQEHSQQLEEAQMAAAAARQQLESAQSETANAESALAQAHEAAGEAQATGDPAAIEAAQKAVQEAEAALGNARQTLDEADARAKAAGYNVETATKLAQQAQQQAETMQREAELARGEAEAGGVAVPDQPAVSSKEAALRVKLIATLQHQVESTQKMVEELERVTAELESRLEGMEEGTERTHLEQALEYAKRETEQARSANHGAAAALEMELNGGEPASEEDTADPAPETGELPPVDPKQAQIEAKELSKLQSLAQTHQEFANEAAQNLAEMEVNFADVLTNGTDDEKAAAEEMIGDARARAASAADVATRTQQALSAYQQFLGER